MDTKVKRAIVIEPYQRIADVIGGLLEELGFEVDFDAAGQMAGRPISSRPYDLAIINLDQNNPDWRDYGLELASQVRASGVRVIMIPDHQLDERTIRGHGWLMLCKPFTLKRLKDVIESAMEEPSTKMNESMN